MPTHCMKFFRNVALATVAFALLASFVQAQLPGPTLGLPVRIWAQPAAGSTGLLTISGSFLESAPGANDGYVTATASAPELSVDLGTVRIEVGKSYTLYGSGASGSTEAIITAPPGYSVTIDGLSRTRASLSSGAVVFLVRPAGLQHPGLAGLASSVSHAGIEWRIPLGTLMNGQPAGEVAFVDTGRSDDWSTLLTPSMFQCEPTSQEVIVVRQPWSLSVYAPQMGVAVGSSGGLVSIYCYSGTQVTYGQPGFIGPPVWIYTISIGSTPTSLLITRETKNQSGNTTRTEFMKLERSGTWPNYSWLKTDWTLAGQQPLKEVATLGSAQSPGRVEQISVRAPGGPAVLGLSREYTALACGEMMTRETLGTTNSMSSSFDYFSDTTKPGVFGYLRSAALADGNWTAFEYYDTNTPLSFGGSRVKYQFRPYLDAPATPTFDANLGEVTYYTYVADEYGALVRPNLIEKRVNGTVTARTQIGYGNEAYYFWNGYFWGQLETVSRTDSTGGAETLVTSTKKFLESVGSTIVRGQVYSNTTPDGLRTSYAYQRGTLAGTTFTPAVDGPHSRIVAITGVAETVVGAPPALLTYATSTIDPVCPVEGKSTLRAVIRNAKAQVVREETHAWVGGAWVLVDHVSYTYDYAGREIERRTQNGLVTNVTFVGGLKTSEVKGDGVVSTYSYDFASRLSSVRREGYASVGTLTTSYVYSAADQVLSETQTGWNGATLVTARTFDDSGRLVSEAPPGLGATTYTYDVPNRSQTASRPDGSTVTESRYRDGRPKSRTGTGVVPEYFSHGVQSDGRRWSRTDKGLLSSPRWETILVDWAGRSLRKERPGFTGQPLAVEENTYLAITGRLSKTTRTGFAPTRYEYDLLGSVVRTGLDLNDNGLVLASNDRISEKESLIELFNGAYWRKTMERRYGSANSSAVTTVSIVRNRLTGYVTNRVAEQQTTDVNGNVTVETIDIDRNSRTSTKTTSRTGVGGSSVEISENGFPVRTRDLEGLWTSMAYDSLHRPSAATDSRGNVTTTSYLAGTSLKAWIKDATNQTVATFGYDSYGRVIWQADALGHLTRTAYNLRGQVLRQWGGGTYPVEYGYDSTYGDRVTLNTFRGGTSWDGSTWPSSPGTADTTTFAFDGPSGLMVSKTDAQSRATLYTYNNQAQLATREWSRLVSSGPNSGQRVKTTYTYDTATGEQTAITYNDGSTPGLSYSYNRLGLSTSITDDAGSRQLDYNLATGDLLSETLNSTFYGGRKLTAKRDQTNTGTLGRITGYQLGTTSSPALDQDVSYGYENLARFTTLTTGFANNSSTRTFRYGYEPDSQLLKTLSVDGSPFLVSRTYEDDRDLVISIESKWTSSPATTFTKFSYTYDLRSQRSSALQDGVAFADYGDATYRQFIYNGRGEVTGAVGYLGTNVTSTAQPLPGRRYEYGYDHIGNRQWANRTGVISLRDDYTANSLNQYVTRENNTVSISGTADASAVVAVNGRNVTAGRQGKFWSDEVTVSNVLNAWRGPISVYATKPSGGNALLRLDSRTAQTAAVLESFTHDLDGNMLSDGLWNYRWDGENRLTRMETTTAAQSVGVPHRILEFRYDYLGRRIQKRVINGTLSQEVSSRRFIYNGWTIIGEYTAPGGNSFGAIVRTFTWGLDIARSLSDSGGVGALVQLADHATGKTFIPTYDGNGNIASMVNVTSGSLAAAYEYSPYGEALRVEVIDVALADQPFRFSTKWMDDETGFLYYGRRYYDPRNGRFVGRDPIEERGGMSLYGFLENDAINRIDVIGLVPLEDSQGVWHPNAIDAWNYGVRKYGIHYGGTYFTNGIPLGAYMSGNNYFVVEGLGIASRPSSFTLTARLSYGLATMPLRGGGVGGGGNSGNALLYGYTSAGYPNWQARIMADAAQREFTESGFNIGEYALDGALIGASIFVPFAGDVIDIATLLNPNSSWGERGLSLASLIIGFGPLPNLGPSFKALHEAGDDMLNAKFFPNFEALKRGLGSPGEDKIWHHLVEQGPGGRKWGQFAVQNSANVVGISPQLNIKLNAFYSSKREEITGKGYSTVREWVEGMSYQEARAFGILALQNVSSGLW